MLTNLRPLIVLFYVFPLAFTLMWPFIVGVLITVAIKYQNFVLINGFLFWEAIAVTMTAIYCIYRPGMSRKEKWKQWSLSPVYQVLGLVILRPAAYWALTKLGDTSWHTREVTVPESAPNKTVPKADTPHEGDTVKRRLLAVLVTALGLTLCAAAPARRTLYPHDPTASGQTNALLEVRDHSTASKDGWTVRWKIKLTCPRGSSYTGYAIVAQRNPASIPSSSATTPELQLASTWPGPALAGSKPCA